MASMASLVSDGVAGVAARRRRGGGWRRWCRRRSLGFRRASRVAIWLRGGGPATGACTYASRLSNLIVVPHIATGDLVREEIHLEKLQVSDRGLVAISACSNLEILHLVKTPECTDAGLSAIAEKCRLLRKIHIDGWKTNRIGDEGLMTVARRCPNLQELVLIGVNPTAQSLGLIATNCRSLERLALCGSETFGDAEISCIAAKCVALKKLCIKGCPVSDQGMEALAEGCPNLVKVKVKKCRGVTPEGADWLRANRESLAVNLDTVIGESGVLEDQLPELAAQVPPIGLPSSSSGRSTPWKSRMSLFTGRNIFQSTIRRWSHGSSNSYHK